MPTGGKGVLGALKPGKGALRPDGKLALFTPSGAACDCCACVQTLQPGFYTNFSGSNHPPYSIIGQNGVPVGTNTWDTVSVANKFYSDKEFPSVPGQAIEFQCEGNVYFRNPGNNDAYQYGNTIPCQSISVAFSVTMDWQYTVLFDLLGRKYLSILTPIPNTIFGVVVAQVDYIIQLVSGTYVKRTRVSPYFSSGGIGAVTLSGWVSPLALEVRAELINPTTIRRSTIINGTETHYDTASLYADGLYNHVNNCFAFTPTISERCFASSPTDSFMSIETTSLTVAFDGLATVF